MKLTLTLALLPGLLAAPVHADVLDARRLPADVRWFAHVDVDALNTSALASALRPGGALDLGQAPLGIGAELGVDLWRDLRSFTVYSLAEGEPAAGAPAVRVEARAEGEHARVALGTAEAELATAHGEVVVLVGRAPLDTALARLAERPEHRLDTLAGRTVHAWGSGDDALYVWTGETSTHDRLVVQASDKALLARALAVLEGRAPNLADAPAPALRARPAEGSLVFAAATTRLAELGGVELASNVARLAEEFVLDVGEVHGAVFARLSVDAKSEREALQIQQVLQGGIALLGLVAGGDADDAELRAIQALGAAFRFQSRGNTVQAEFELPLPALVDALRALGAGVDVPANNRAEPEKK